MTADLVIDCACTVGQSPFWHPDEQQLYWIDGSQGRLFRFAPPAGRRELCYQGEVAGATVQADGALLLFQQGALDVWRGGSPTRLIAQIPAARGAHFSEVIADPVGRVFAAVTSQDGGSNCIYRIETDGSVSLALDGFGQVRGMAFSPDRSRLYLANGDRRQIFRLDYDQVSGELRHPEQFAEVPDAEAEGIPAGLTVDVEGGIWSARWGGGCVVRYSAEGDEEERLLVPAPMVSDICFGGPEFEDLFITSAGEKDGNCPGASAGSLFRAQPGVNGLSGFRSQVLVDAGL